MINLELDEITWLQVLVQNSVPMDQDPDSPMNWEGRGREYAYSLFEKALKNDSQSRGL